jgi:hypothetical protein
MKLLEQIRLFPKAAQGILESQYGIETAEQFYANAVRNPEGIQEALKEADVDLEQLMRVVEGYLAPDYMEQCHAPVVKRPRGVILD